MLRKNGLKNNKDVHVDFLSRVSYYYFYKENFDKILITLHCIITTDYKQAEQAKEHR